MVQSITKKTYSRNVFLYFFIVFMLFTIIIASFQFKREQRYKTQELKAILENYCDIIHNYMKSNQIHGSGNYVMLDSLTQILPRNDIRITIILPSGEVVFDSFKKDLSTIENHRFRPEVRKALLDNKGTDIRTSGTVEQPFFYLAKNYDDYYVRTAALYSVSLEKFLKVESLFIYFIIGLFIITSIFLLYVSGKIGRSISALKDFAVRAGKNENIESTLTFPENELGTISKEIIAIYNNLQKTNKELQIEKEKLIHHLQLSNQGIAVFTETHEKILANNHFMQYLNIIADSPITTAEEIFNLRELQVISTFIAETVSSPSQRYRKNLPMKRISIEKNSRFFEILCVVFNDKSYEIIIYDETKSVRQKKLKQEMTSNIAHELRTPVSSIKGYLETILNSKNIPTEKQLYFVDKAFKQIQRLSELIQDISTLTKIEEASDFFKVEEVRIRSIINDVTENLQSRIQEIHATITCDIKPASIIFGNKALVYSIFQNLLENSLKYGGQDISITISEYHEDDDFYYYSFSDTGIGIAEEHQNRVFERFYRVEDGRARNTGGTGLGLAIVKNAVLHHQGEIMVKTHKSGGAEFLFSLAKSPKEA